MTRYLVIVAFVAFFLVVIALVQMSDLSDEAQAAWAQAFFSAGAIIAAWWLGGVQTRSTEALPARREKAVEYAARLSMAQIIGYVSGLVDVLPLGVRDDKLEGLKVFRRQIDEALTATTAIPASEITNLELQGAFRLVASRADSARGQAHKSAE